MYFILVNKQIFNDLFLLTFNKKTYKESNIIFYYVALKNLKEGDGS